MPLNRPLWRLRWLPWTLLAVASSASAQVPPPQQPAEAKLPDSAAAFRPPTVQDALLTPVPSAAIEISNWNQVLSYLRSRSPDLRLALLEVVRAEGQARTALAAALPSITASGSATLHLLRGQVPSGYDYTPLLRNPPSAPIVTGTSSVPASPIFGASITLTQPLLALREWHGVETAKLSTEVAKLSVQDSKRVIALAVASSVMSVVAAERAAEINRVGLQSALERLALTRRRQTLGASTSLDVLRADQDVAITRASVVSGDESLRQSREALGQSLGVPQAVGVTRDISLDELQTSSMQACRATDNLNARADIRVAREQIELARRSVKDVELQFLPSVNFVSRTDLSSEPLLNTRHVAWSIAGVLSVPIWDGGAKYGLLRSNRAMVEEAGVRLGATQRQARMEVVQARRAVSVTEESRKVAENARDLAREAERLARISFEMGKTTSFELIDAGRRLREAELNLAMREFDVVQARLAAVLSLAECTW